MRWRPTWAPAAGKSISQRDGSQPLTLGELRLGTVLDSLEPDHRASADPEWTFLSGWLYAF